MEAKAFVSDEREEAVVTESDRQIEAAAQWFVSPRFAGIVRLYSPRQVAEQQGTISDDYTVARQAAEAFYPRLRELFSAQGMSLTDAGVFKEPPKNQSAWNEGRGIDGESASQADATVSSVRMRLGLVDAYA